MFWGISCTIKTEYEYYILHIENNYFEPLYDVKIDEALITDTLDINDISKNIMIYSGVHQFSAETKSGLLLKTKLHAQGDQSTIHLKINEQGNVIMW